MTTTMMMMHLFITVDSGGEITRKAEQQRATLYKRRQKNSFDWQA